MGRSTRKTTNLAGRREKTGEAVVGGRVWVVVETREVGVTIKPFRGKVLAVVGVTHPEAGSKEHRYRVCRACTYVLRISRKFTHAFYSNPIP